VAANVLFVIDKLIVGGAQVHLLDVVSSLDTARFRPQVCCLGESGAVGREMQARGVPVKALGLEKIYDRKARSALRPLARWIREQQVDLVHTYLPSSNVYGALATRLAGVSRIVTSRRDMGFSRSWRMAVLEQSLVNPIARRVVTVCDAVGRVARRDWFLNGNKVLSIHNGIDLANVDAVELRPAHAVKASFDLLAAGRVVTIVANFTPVKAHDLFLRAAAEVRRTAPETRFVLVGDGPLRARLEPRVAELGLDGHVVFAGRRPRPEVLELLSVTDVGVLCSETEGMSNALLEFMAMGAPVVATRVGGNPEIVEHESTGLLVPPRDPGALAAGMLELLEDPDRAARMGAAGRRRVEEKFTTAKMVHKLERLYDEVLAAR